MPGSGAQIDFFHRDDGPAPPSNRSFGLVFAAVFAIIALLPLRSGEAARTWAVGLSAVFLLSALAWPRLLAPANRLWFRIGLLLHRVVNPLIMGALFYGVLTPFAVIMRWRRPELRRRMQPEPDAASYWLPRDTAGIRMDRQF